MLDVLHGMWRFLFYPKASYHTLSASVFFQRPSQLNVCTSEPSRAFTFSRGVKQVLRHVALYAFTLPFPQRSQLHSRGVPRYGPELFPWAGAGLCRYVYFIYLTFFCVGGIRLGWQINEKTRIEVIKCWRTTLYKKKWPNFSYQWQHFVCLGPVDSVALDDRKLSMKLPFLKCLKCYAMLSSICFLPPTVTRPPRTTHQRRGDHRAVLLQPGGAPGGAEGRQHGGR